MEPRWFYMILPRYTLRWFTHDVGIPSNDLGISRIVFSSFTWTPNMGNEWNGMREMMGRLHVVREICRLSFFGWKRPLNDEHVSLLYRICQICEYIEYIYIYIVLLCTFKVQWNGSILSDLRDSSGIFLPQVTSHNPNQRRIFKRATAESDELDQLRREKRQQR